MLLTSESKVCQSCDPPKRKPLSEFYRRAASRDGHSSRCKECEQKAHQAYNRRTRTKHLHRKSNLKILYNITIEDFNNMWEAQGGACAICFRTGMKLVVDHNHATGQARELLCNRCNHGLGRFDDNPVLLQNAIMYLEKHNERKKVTQG